MALPELLEAPVDRILRMFVLRAGRRLSGRGGGLEGRGEMMIKYVGMSTDMSRLSQRFVALCPELCRHTFRRASKGMSLHRDKGRGEGVRDMRQSSGWERGFCI